MKKYGTIVIELDLQVRDEDDNAGRNAQDYLETNLNEEVQSVINYAKTQIHLGPDHLAVKEGRWSWA